MSTLDAEVLAQTENRLNTLLAQRGIPAIKLTETFYAIEDSENKARILQIATELSIALSYGNPLMMGNVLIGVIVGYALAMEPKVEYSE